MHFFVVLVSHGEQDNFGRVSGRSYVSKCQSLYKTTVNQNGTGMGTDKDIRGTKYMPLYYKAIFPLGRINNCAGIIY